MQPQICSNTHSIQVAVHVSLSAAMYLQLGSRSTELSGTFMHDIVLVCMFVYVDSDIICTDNADHATVSVSMTTYVYYNYMSFVHAIMHGSFVCTTIQTLQCQQWPPAG